VGNVSLIIFQDNCVGCHACEVACKQEHGLDVGPRLIKVLERAPFYVTIYCHHCTKPPCKDACPEEAIFRDETGIVQIKQDRCIGCKACLEACPFGSLQFDELREVAVKCDLCHERLKNDEEPACATVCPTRCILFGDMKRISKELEERSLLGSVS
jgi:NADH-dependent fumarate reductase subunit E